MIQLESWKTSLLLYGLLLGMRDLHWGPVQVAPYLLEYRRAATIRIRRVTVSGLNATFKTGSDRRSGCCNTRSEMIGCQMTAQLSKLQKGKSSKYCTVDPARVIDKSRSRTSNGFMHDTCFGQTALCFALPYLLHHSSQLHIQAASQLPPWTRQSLPAASAPPGLARLCLLDRRAQRTSDNTKLHHQDC